MIRHKAPWALIQAAEPPPVGRTTPSEAFFDRLRYISRVPDNTIGLANRSRHGWPNIDFIKSHHDIGHKRNRKRQRAPEEQEQRIQGPLTREKIDVGFREQHTR